MFKDSIKMEVHGGLCDLVFTPGVSTGPEGSDSRDGIGFDLFPTGERLPKHMGVIGRSDAKKLRDLINEALGESNQQSK